MREAGDDDWIGRQLADPGRGLTREQRAEQQRASAVAVYNTRRSLWSALVARCPSILAAEVEARARDRGDYSNRNGVRELRLVVAQRLGARAEQIASGKAGPSPLFLFADIPASPALRKHSADVWPDVDLVVDRDAKSLIEAARQSVDGEVKACLRAFEGAMDRACRLNGRMVLKLAQGGKFYATERSGFDTEDLIAAGMAGLHRGLCDYHPRRGMPSTHIMPWITKHMHALVDGDGTVRQPTYVRAVRLLVENGSPAYRQLTEKLALVDGLATELSRAVGKDRKAEIADLLGVPVSSVRGGEAGIDRLRSAVRRSVAGKMAPPVGVDRMIAIVAEVDRGVEPERAAELADVLGAPSADPICKGGRGGVRSAVGHYAEASGKGLRAFLDALHTAPAIVEDIGQHQSLGCAGLVGDVIEAEEAELAARVREALIQLPDDQREALRRTFGLDDRGGAGARAVARGLRVTESEVNEIIRQGLASMAAMLGEGPCTYTS